MMKIIIVVIFLLLSALVLLKTCHNRRRESFVSAVRDGNVDALDRLLRKGVKVNTRWRYFGWTGLMYAAYHGHLDCVRFLLRNGADVNKKSKMYWRLVFLGHTEMVAYGMHYQTGRTALMNAALRGHGEVVKLLLENGAEVNARTDSGWTALMAAVSKANTGIVRTLLEYGADTEVRDMDFGMNAREIAENRDYSEIVQILETANRGIRLPAAKTARLNSQDDRWRISER
jgi:ankyrin repeat protein